MKKLVSVMKEYMPVRVKRIKNGFLRGAASVLLSPVVYARDFRRINYAMRDKYVLYYVEVFVTTRCSLRCTYCAAGMPSYKELYDIDYDLVEQSLAAFLDHIDYIENVRILGGEPFLYQALDRVLAYLLTRRDRIGNIRIVTNGTIVPKGEALLRAMNDRKVVVDISNYGALSRKVPELLALKKQYRFRVKLGPQLKWSKPDMHYEKRDMAPKLLAHKFTTCGEHCRLIRDGKLFYCGPSFWTLFIEGAEVTGDYVDLLHNAHPETLREQIIDLYFNKPYLAGCDYCPGSFLHRPLVLDAGSDQLPQGECQDCGLLPGFREVEQRHI